MIGNDDMKTPTSSSDEEDIYCDSLDPDQVCNIFVVFFYYLFLCATY